MLMTIQNSVAVPAVLACPSLSASVKVYEASDTLLNFSADISANPAQDNQLAYFIAPGLYFASKCNAKNDTMRNLRTALASGACECKRFTGDNRSREVALGKRTVIASVHFGTKFRIHGKSAARFLAMNQTSSTNPEATVLVATPSDSGYSIAGALFGRQFDLEFRGNEGDVSNFANFICNVALNNGKSTSLSQLILFTKALSPSSGVERFYEALSACNPVLTLDASSRGCAWLLKFIKSTPDLMSSSTTNLAWLFTTLQANRLSNKIPVPVAPTPKGKTKI